MLKFTEHQRLTYAEKMHDLANFAIAGLAFGQSVSPAPFNWTFTRVGVLMYIVLTSFAFLLNRRDAQQ